MYTIKYYGNSRKARTASGAVKAAKQMSKLYGQGNRNPVIDSESEAEAKEMVNFQQVSQTCYCVQLNGQAVC